MQSIYIVRFYKIRFFISIPSPSFQPEYRPECLSQPANRLPNLFCERGRERRPEEHVRATVRLGTKPAPFRTQHTSLDSGEEDLVLDIEHRRRRRFGVETPVDLDPMLSTKSDPLPKEKEQCRGNDKIISSC